ncbi:MAG: hypothetical protein EPN36_16815 [Rhodanobacteraceae bacterium]|nr:MAG: hypothetical protein EPN36_16815 [Rhodanobacteraceae bacterium]
MKAHESPTEPIACTLDADAHRERRAWIAELNRSALRGVRREGARLILTYDLQACGGVREMVHREQKCCAFLRFELHENENAVTLAITAPDRAGDTLDALFDPFLTGRNAGDDCTCAVATR